MDGRYDTEVGREASGVARVVAGIGCREAWVVFAQRASWLVVSDGRDLAGALALAFYRWAARSAGVTRAAPITVRYSDHRLCHKVLWPMMLY